MRDLAFFHGDIRDLSWKQEGRIASGRGVHEFIGLGCEIGKGNSNGASTGVQRAKKELICKYYSQIKNGGMGEVERRKGRECDIWEPYWRPSVSSLLACAAIITSEDEGESKKSTETRVVRRTRIFSSHERILRTLLSYKNNVLFSSNMTINILFTSHHTFLVTSWEN